MEAGWVFRIRSMTKPFTGTAAMMLIADGALDLGAPVSQYLPSWDNEVSGEITVEQLLTAANSSDDHMPPASCRSRRHKAGRRHQALRSPLPWWSAR